MTREEIIKSALKFLIQKQTEQGSYGYADRDDNEVSWNEVIRWVEQLTCEDHISRKAAIIALANNRCGNDEWDLAVTHDVETIKRIPSAEPERTSGKWIEGKKTPGYIKWNCSECGLLIRNPQKPWYEYCPKCGADMRDVPETNDKDTESEDKK